jgi:UDP-glucose 4-epimerase
MRLLDLMHKHNTNKLIYFSSGGAIYGNNKNSINKETDPTEPINSYGWMKLTTETYVKMFSYLNKLEYLIVRPSNAYGKYQHNYGKQGIIPTAVHNVLLGKPIEIWGDGNIIRDYIHIDDICNAINLLIKKDKWNETYNIGSNVGTSVNEILNLVGNIAEKNMTINYTPQRNIDIKENILDITKLQSAIKWEPKISLANGIKSYIEWVNDTSKNKS